MNCTIVWLSVFRTTTRGFPLRGSVAGPTAGDALHGPLLDDVLPDEIANPVPGDRVEDVVLDLRVGRDPDPVDADAQDRRRQAPLIVEPHSVTIRFRTRSPFSSHVFSISSRLRVPTAWAMRTACFAASRPSSCRSLCTRTSWNPLG